MDLENYDISTSGLQNQCSPAELQARMPLRGFEPPRIAPHVYLYNDIYRKLIREKGVEPLSPYKGRWSLNPVRLPFRHSRVVMPSQGIEPCQPEATDLQSARNPSSS